MPGPAPTAMVAVAGAVRHVFVSLGRRRIAEFSRWDQRPGFGELSLRVNSRGIVYWEDFEDARRGIEDFFASSGCFANHDVRRLSADAAVPGNQELIALAATASAFADMAIEKNAADELHITLGKTAAGTEIVRLE